MLTSNSVEDYGKGLACLKRQVFNCHLNAVTHYPDGLRKFFLAVGTANVKLHILVSLLGLIEEIVICKKGQVGNTLAQEHRRLVSEPI